MICINRVKLIKKFITTFLIMQIVCQLYTIKNVNFIVCAMTHGVNLHKKNKKQSQLLVDLEKGAKPDIPKTVTFSRKHQKVCGQPQILFPSKNFYCGNAIVHIYQSQINSCRFDHSTKSQKISVIILLFIAHTLYFEINLAKSVLCR